MLRVLAFDVFNTVYSLEGVPSREVARYAHHLELCRKNNVWLPLELPESWQDLQAYPDSAAAIHALRRKGYICVTCSNGPFELQQVLAERNNIPWNGIVPLEAFKTFKTQSAAYLAVCDVWRARPDEVGMVTANKTFGDIEASRGLGMQAFLIRQHAEDDLARLVSRLGPAAEA